MLVLHVQHLGSKVITFAASAKFEIIALMLKTAAMQGESEFCRLGW